MITIFERPKQNWIMEFACREMKTNKSKLRHSRRLASPKEYGDLTEEEKNKTPPAYHKFIRVGPNGEETIYLAAHAKTIFKDGRVLSHEESQRIIWELIGWCTQPKVDFTVATGLRVRRQRRELMTRK